MTEGNPTLLFNRSLFGIVFVALALALGSSASASPGDPSGDGIQPFEVAGNASCQDVFGPNSIELKQEPPKDDTISGGTLTVNVDLSDDKNFMNFSGATVPINGVIVKSANNSNVYSYPLTDTADTLLHGALDANGIHAISHISFCYGAGPPPCVPPAVGLQPVAVVTTYGSGNVQFTANTSGGTTPISVKWQVSTSGAAGPFTDIPGATSTTLTVTNPSVVDDDGNYYRAVFTNSCGSANSNAALLTVNPLALTGTCTVADKFYDGTTTATITGSSLDPGVLPGDDVTLDASGASSSFADPDVGTGKPTPCNGFTLGGADAGNYTLTMSNTTAAINPKVLTGTCTVANKVYDGTTDATVTGSSLGAGVVAGDQVSLTGGSSAFGDPDVGNSKPTPCDGFSLTGADAGNYTLTMSDTTANITPKALTGTCTVADKVYDGTTAATITGSSLGGGVVAGDQVSLTGGSSAFGDPDVGNDKATPCNGFSLTGPDAGNYSLTMSPTTADITPKPITGNCTVANKVYDGTTNATVTGSSLNGVVAGDQVNLTGGSSAFGNPDVGNGKATPCNGFALSGADAGNYTLTMNPTTANITPKPVLVTCTAADKAFDGNSSATITGAILTGVVPGDSVSVGGGSATFNNPNPGEDKPVTCAGFFLEGPDKDNYVLVVDHPTATIQRPPAESPRETCLKRNIFAFVRTGNDAKRVVFFLDGEKLTTVTKRDKKGRFGVHLVRRELGPGKHVLSATVYFKTGRKPVKLIVFKFKPCLGSDVAKELSVPDFGRSCVRRSFLAFVKGDTISSVAFFLNGKLLKMVHIADGKGRYKLLVRPVSLRHGNNTLSVKVTYIRSAKTPPATLKKTIRAC